MSKTIVDAAVNSVYGSAIGCIGGISYALNSPKQDFAVLIGFVGGAIVGAVVGYFLLGKTVANSTLLADERARL